MGGSLRGGWKWLPAWIGDEDRLKNSPLPHKSAISAATTLQTNNNPQKNSDLTRSAAAAHPASTISSHREQLRSISQSHRESHRPPSAATRTRDPHYLRSATNSRETEPPQRRASSCSTTTPRIAAVSAAAVLVSRSSLRLEPTTTKEPSSQNKNAKVAKSLQYLETKENWSKEHKWEMISHVWVEMLCHAASQCRELVMEGARAQMGATSGKG
ncbi:hypothetical protein SESBI_49947 [Sesbania bispinosa]|nr:hypothetical protein SESBI_49947 [Sesbania bispinosa]